MEFSEFKLWSEDQLLESININEVKDFVKKETTFWKNNDSSKIAKEWYILISLENEISVKNNNRFIFIGCHGAREYNRCPKT